MIQQKCVSHVSFDVLMFLACQDGVYNARGVYGGRGGGGGRGRNSLIWATSILVCVAPKCMFSAVLIINRVLILATLLSNRVWFLSSCLELDNSN